MGSKWSKNIVKTPHMKSPESVAIIVHISRSAKSALVMQLDPKWDMLLHNCGKQSALLQDPSAKVWLVETSVNRHARFHNAQRQIWMNMT